MDDLLDRAKDLETGVRDAVNDVVDDDESTPAATSGPGVAELQAALAELTAKVNLLADLQLASSAGKPTPASRSAAA